MALHSVWLQCPLPRRRRPALHRVDRLLDRSLKDLRAAEQLADQKHLGGTDRSVDEGIRLTREAERNVDKALAMIREAGEENVSKAQGEQIERLITEAKGQLRRVEEMIDKSTQRSEDHMRLRRMLGHVDRQVDEALEILHKGIAGL